MNASAVIYDNLSVIARECVQIADEAFVKLAGVESELAEVRRRSDALVLTKVAANDAELPLDRVAATVNRLVATGFVKRSNRLDTISGIRSAPRAEIFAILEKLASIAVCPVHAIADGDDGEAIVKAAGQPADATSTIDDVWTAAWKQAKAQA